MLIIRKLNQKNQKTTKSRKYPRIFLEYFQHRVVPRCRKQTPLQLRRNYTGKEGFNSHFQLCFSLVPWVKVVYCHNSFNYPIPSFDEGMRKIINQWEYNIFSIFMYILHHKKHQRSLKRRVETLFVQALRISHFKEKNWSWLSQDDTAKL